MRNKDDYYVTPHWVIEEFLNAWLKADSFPSLRSILDPCAGGDEKTHMSYPHVIGKTFNIKIATNDIREDSPADTHYDFLNSCSLENHDLIITNPPFSLAMNFLKKALIVSERRVAMLFRLGFFGSKKRNDFWLNNMPKYCFIHSRRPSFDGGGSDNSEYMHCVWALDEPKRDYTETRILEYKEKVK